MFRESLPVAFMTALAMFPSVAPAQDAPAMPRQIRIIIASVPGAGPDFISRLMAPKLSEALRSSVVVENRPGTNGVVAAQFTAKSAPDGSVLMMGNAGTHAINAALYKKLEYDPMTDFAPISEVAATPLALALHPVVPARTVKELIALARKSPGKINVGVAGAAGELMGNDFMLRAKIDMKNIPYKGGSQAALAVLSGEADLVFTSYVVIAAHVEAGRLRVLGVTSSQRMQQFPQVPTIAESGLTGYDHEQWYALFGPAKLPPAIVQLVQRETTRIANLPEIHERLVATGHRVIAGTPPQLADKVKREIEKTRRIIQASGMQQH